MALDTQALTQSNATAPFLVRPQPPSLSERVPDTTGVAPHVHKPPAIPILSSLPTTLFVPPKLDANAALSTGDVPFKPFLSFPASAVVPPALGIATMAEMSHPEDSANEAASPDQASAEEAPKAASIKASPFAFKVTCKPAAPAPMSFSTALPHSISKKALRIDQTQKQEGHVAVTASVEAYTEVTALPSKSETKRELVDTSAKAPAEKEEGLTATVAATLFPASVVTSLPLAIKEPLHFETTHTVAHQSSLSTSSLSDAEDPSVAISPPAGVEVVISPKTDAPAAALIQSPEEIVDLQILMSPKKFLMPDPPPTLVKPPAIHDSYPVPAPSVTPIFTTESPPDHQDPTTVQPGVQNNMGISFYCACLAWQLEWH